MFKDEKKKKKKIEEQNLPDLSVSQMGGMGIFPDDIPFSRNIGCAPDNKPKKPQTDTK